MKYLIFIFTFLNLSSFAKDKIRSDYIGVRFLFPASLLEWDAIYSGGIHAKYGHLGLDVEYGRVIGVNSYNQSGPLFEANASGNRIRGTLKYYINQTWFGDNRFHYLVYLGFRPSLKNVDYQMKWWYYDSLVANDSFKLAMSNMPVSYSSRNFSFHLMVGNEMYLLPLSFDFYAGVGLRYYSLQFSDNTPSYFRIHTQPNESGVATTIILGVKVGLSYRFKRSKPKSTSR